MAPEGLSVEALSNHVKGLPTLPSVLAELSRRLEDPKTSSEDLAQVIQQDQAISSKVLKLVNSPFYGYSGRIHTINQGIVILGFNAVKNLVLSTSVMEAFKDAESGEGFRVDLLWIHSASVAGVAKVLAERSGVGDPEEAFVAGLLHDIGKILVWTSNPKLLSACIQASQSRKMPLESVETQVLGFRDAELAAVLAEKWKFPNSLRESLRWNPEPERAGAAISLASVVHAANALCIAMGSSSVQNPVFPAISAKAWQILGLSNGEFLRRILAEVPARIESARVFVSSA